MPYENENLGRLQAWLDSLDKRQKKRAQKHLLKMARNGQGIQPLDAIALVALTENVSAARAWEITRQRLDDGKMTCSTSATPNGPREFVPAARLRGKTN
jgi:hypothetical protein